MKIFNKKINLTPTKLLSALIIQYFIYQILMMGINPTGGNWYFTILLKIKYSFNTFFGNFKLSIGDCFYILLGILFIYSLFKIIIFLFKKEKSKAIKHSIFILFTINFLYGWFMLSFGLLYSQKPFTNYQQNKGHNYLDDYKIVANHLLNECIELREKLPSKKSGELYIGNDIINELYQEQSAVYGIPLQKSNVKNSLFSLWLTKIGVLGYYNPFTGEAQTVNGLPPTSYPFTIAHEMGHQAGIAREDNANFYAFYMGESSSIQSFQYSVKYKALQYILREIYIDDSTFVHRIINNYSTLMKKDREIEIKYYSLISDLGSDAFSVLNNAYLRSNSQNEGIVAYNQVSNMIVNFYKGQYPSLFINEALIKSK